jgi:hypothetical protein
MHASSQFANAPTPLIVAQISNLLYRGFPIRWRCDIERPAECNSAIQQSSTLRYIRTTQRAA